MPEFLKLEYIKVSVGGGGGGGGRRSWHLQILVCVLQEIGFAHMRITEGVDSLLQLSGLLARLCLKVQPIPTS